MQVIYQNEDKGRSSGRTDIVDFIICVERISRCVKGKYFGRFRKRIIRV